MTEEETAALLAYKSSESYKINTKLRGEDELTDTDKQFVGHMDGALAKMPTYPGKVYRSIIFDGVGGKEAFETFMADVEPGAILPALAYTSTSTAVDGYPLEGEYVVRMVIEGQTGRDMEGFGNNFEGEVLFERRKKFSIEKVVYDENGTPTIYMTEVTSNGKID